MTTLVFMIVANRKIWFSSSDHESIVIYICVHFLDDVKYVINYNAVFYMLCLLYFLTFGCQFNW